MRRNSVPVAKAARTIAKLRMYNGRLVEIALDTGLSYSLISKLHAGHKKSMSPKTMEILNKWIEGA